MGPPHAPARGSIEARVARSLLGIVVLLAVLIALWPGGVRGATPTPIPEQADPFPTVETWIDSPVSDPAYRSPDGKTLLVGATLWNVRDHDLFAVDGLTMKLYPASGNAKPTSAPAVPDVPGHLTAQLPIPAGGPGRVAIVTTGQECAADGTCHDSETPLRISGTGPPPDAPTGDLLKADLLPLTGDVVAGQPVTIRVTLQPIGLWGDKRFPLPDQLEVTGTRPGGGRMVAARLRQDQPGQGQPYQGSMRFPDPGEVTLGAAFIDGSGRTQPIAGELGPIRVIGTAAGGSTGDATGDGSSARPTSTAGTAQAPSAAASGEADGPPWIVLGAIAVLVLGLVLFLGEPLTRRFRADGRDDRP